jgi:hypothetical protein
MAEWTDEECRTAIRQIIRLERRTPGAATQLYWIQIKDEDGYSHLVTTWDWTDQDLPVALCLIRRLAHGRKSASSPPAVR